MTQTRFIKAKHMAVLASLILFSHTAFAVDDTNLLETTFFQRSYTQDSPEQRLARLEEFLFGEVQSGAIQERYSHLLEVAVQNKVSLDSKPVLDSETDTRLGQKNVLDGADPNQNGYQGNNLPQELIPEADANKYPTVSAMEHRVFGNDSEGQEIMGRLERLEIQTFKHAFPEKGLSERVDQLTLRILPENPLAQEMHFMPNRPWQNNPTVVGPSAFGANRFPDSSNQMISHNVAIYGQLTALEMKTLGASFGGEPLTTRLNRLEIKFFGRLQSGPVDDRFARLSENAAGVNPVDTRRYGPAVFNQPSQPMMIPGWPAPDGPPREAYIPYTSASPMRQAVVPSASSQPLIGAMNLSPDVMQSVSDMELDVFGRSFDGINLNNRMTNLEIKALTRTFPTMPLNERLSQLKSLIYGQQRNN